MGRPAGWMQKLTGRGTMRSPGAPSLWHEIERRFWQQITTRITSEKAADAVGVSPVVGARWFLHRGGMPLFMSIPYRVSRARAQAKAWAHVSEDIRISNRPAEVEDRAVPRHWKGDLIIRLNRFAIATLVERSSRFTMLVHLPREKGYGLLPRTKNGPALAGYAAVTMTNALKETIRVLPSQLWWSLTWDRGKELSDHVRFTIESGVKFFFAAPHSPHPPCIRLQLLLTYQTPQNTLLEDVSRNYE